ncbi:uncharacterized protein B0J16DRAFT_408148 [Fusarium flagelliforme]|uniref:uncharacterized protein n=1 Tax=Fusarium flagelliforme TaxID=2675880 RepID=UPI001E8D87F3|nr:uncharacterized protein B0J16DRAFT_408148 [Fusarium flagelliforme]KAH7196416.1 hypothetical protein B0J16DRAFT_408148 [Fusarium flagelliforme]
MIPQTFKHLLAAILATSSVYAGSFSDLETWSTTALSTVEPSTTAETQSSLETSSSTEVYSSTEATTTTVFEISATETSTTAEVTTTAPVDEPCQTCSQVIVKSGRSSSCGRQIAPWQADPFLVKTVQTQNILQCAYACSNECHCKSFSFYGDSCYLYDADEQDMQVGNFYLGPYYFDLASCYECVAGGD